VNSSAAATVTHRVSETLAFAAMSLSALLASVCQLAWVVGSDNGFDYRCSFLHIENYATMGRVAGGFTSATALVSFVVALFLKWGQPVRWLALVASGIACGAVVMSFWVGTHIPNESSPTLALFGAGFLALAVLAVTVVAARRHRSETDAEADGAKPNGHLLAFAAAGVAAALSCALLILRLFGLETIVTSTCIFG
jgi:hypothetical protein